jgi:hypothetical protein
MLLSARGREESTPTRFHPRCNPRAPCPIAARTGTAPSASNTSSGYGLLQVCCLRWSVFVPWRLRFSHEQKATHHAVTFLSSHPVRAPSACPLGHLSTRRGKSQAHRLKPPRKELFPGVSALRRNHSLAALQKNANKGLANLYSRKSSIKPSTTAFGSPLSSSSCSSGNMSGGSSPAPRIACPWAKPGKNPSQFVVPPASWCIASLTGFGHGRFSLYPRSRTAERPL